MLIKLSHLASSTMGFISIRGVYHRSNGLNSIFSPRTIDDELIYLATLLSSKYRHDYLHFPSSVFYIGSTTAFVQRCNRNIWRCIQIQLNAVPLLRSTIQFLVCNDIFAMFCDEFLKELLEFGNFDRSC